MPVTLEPVETFEQKICFIKTWRFGPDKIQITHIVQEDGNEIVIDEATEDQLDSILDCLGGKCFVVKGLEV